MAYVRKPILTNQASYIGYKSSVVGADSDMNGITVMAPGDTFVMKTKDKVMEDDIFFKAGVPSLQEKTVTENGEVTPDEGYDGLSKVTIDVLVETIEEYDGTVVIE